jgi:hypothetical protein
MRRMVITRLFAESLTTKSAVSRSKGDDPLYFGSGKQIQCPTDQSQIRCQEKLGQ